MAGAFIGFVFVFPIALGAGIAFVLGNETWLVPWTSTLLLIGSIEAFGILIGSFVGIQWERSRAEIAELQR